MRFYMRKVKTDNSDLIQYLDTVKELKNYIPIEEYRNEYRKLCSDNIPWIKIKKFKSAHTELRRLDKKRESLIELFIDELNPISMYCMRECFIPKHFQKKVMKKLLPWS